MKTKIIGILFVAVLIVAGAVFIQMYANKEKTSKISVSSKEQTSTNSTIINVNKEIISNEKNDYKESDFEYDEETVITLADGATIVDGKNVKVDGDNIYIVAAGVYRIKGTLSNGRIIVNAPKENVKIILDNASITCLFSSPLYVFKSSATMIYVEDGTTNELEDGNTYTFNDEFSTEDDDEPNATLYSKSDLIICGKGSLSVKANYKNGITSKDTLYIKDASLNVESKNNGINGKDNNTIKNATIGVVSGGDGIRSTNDKDESLGWIKIEDSTITIDSKEDAIQAETDLAIYGGTINITAGEGSSSSNKKDNSIFGRDRWGSNSSSNDEISTKGIKAGRFILIEKDPTITIDSADDAIHSNSSVEINSGTYSIKTGDDGIHADDTLTINNGTIPILESYEGLEGNNIVINDGTIDIVASDDGINVNGGNDGSGFGGFGGNININDNDIPQMPEGMSFDESNKPEMPDEMNFDESNRPEMPQDVNFGDKSKTRPDGSSRIKPENFSGDKPNMPGNMTRPETNNNNVSDNSNEINSSKSAYYLIINGGTINVNAEGDGLDSNGAIEMNGGNIIVNGPSNSANSALDYDQSFVLTNGTVIAIGSSGMAQGIKVDGRQGTIMTTLSNTFSKDAKVELKDENGNTVLEATSCRQFNNIVMTSEDIINGNTYYIYINGEKQAEVTASTDTSSKGFGGFGNFGGRK